MQEFPTGKKQRDATVSLSRCPDYESKRIYEAICRHFELNGGIGNFIKTGDRVLLKPNMIVPKSRKYAAQTDPTIILETARVLKDYGAKVIVGDSPAWSNIFECVKVLRLEEKLNHLGVQVKQLNQPVKVLLPKSNARVNFSSVALDVDVIINLPKFKAHQQMGATFAIKNMFGCVSGKQKPFWHFAKGKSEFNFCRLLIEIFEYLNPALTIIDGVIAMDGAGPIHGRARKLGWIIAGTEPIACELVCSKLVGFDPDTLPIIRTAKKMGFGTRDINDIRIIGEDANPVDIDNVICEDFESAKPIPIRFTFGRVCKSISKQAVIRIKSKLHRPSV